MRKHVTRERAAKNTEKHPTDDENLTAKSLVVNI